MLNAPVSVVIPCYNSARFIREAIESVYGQTLAVSEIIVVDNNSSDDSRQIAEGLGVKVIEEKKQGTPKARNSGTRVSTQEWIAFLDADDVWHRNKIECQWRAIENCSSVGIVFTDYQVMQNNSIVLTNSAEALENRWKHVKGKSSIGGASHFANPGSDFFLRFCPLPSTAMINRDVFASIGEFDERMSYLDDLEFFWRAAARFAVAIVERPLVNYRKHEDNISRNVAGKRQAFFSLVNRMIANPDVYPAGAGEAYLGKIMDPFVKARLQTKEVT